MTVDDRESLSRIQLFMLIHSFLGFSSTFWTGLK